MTRNSRSLSCRVCAGQGSSLEQLAYKILDQSTAVGAFAVEAYAVSGQVQHEGQLLQVNRHAWDVVLLQPAGLLIEVQGEQHSSKLMTKRNCQDSSLSSRISRDHALAAAALEAEFCVLWLSPGKERNRKARWTRAIKLALQHLQEKKQCKLFKH